MIKVKYELIGDRYHLLDVSGHANYAKSGQDLFCSAVSSIMFGLMNALDELKEDVEIKQLTNEIIIVDNSNSKVVALENGGLTLGTPYVEGAKVSCKVEKQGKGKKIVIFKYKQKTGSTRRKQGHRQPYTKLTVEKIG